jgi:hypothetical protein
MAIMNKLTATDSIWARQVDADLTKNLTVGANLSAILEDRSQSMA